jgi:serine/threonine-protein kinase
LATGELARHTAPWPAIDGWVVEGLLGRGRFASVHAARPAGLARAARADYALKVLKPECECSPAAIETLRREAGASRIASSPHLASVLGAHLTASPYFLVLPRLEGADLAAVLAEGWRPSVPVALWVARQTAAGLAALHAAGWLHGDVKPANITISPQGHATLIDLGLARPIGANGPHCNFAAGAPAYLAPEALAPTQPLGAPVDLYALGVMLHELLIGALPGKAPPRTGFRKRSTRVPTGLMRLLSRLLANEPLRRPSAAEAVDELRRLEIDTLVERNDPAFDEQFLG